MCDAVKDENQNCLKSDYPRGQVWGFENSKLRNLRANVSIKFLPKSRGDILGGELHFICRTDKNDSEISSRHDWELAHLKTHLRVWEKVKQNFEKIALSLNSKIQTAAVFQYFGPSVLPCKYKNREKTASDDILRRKLSTDILPRKVQRIFQEMKRFHVWQFLFFLHLSELKTIKQAWFLVSNDFVQINNSRLKPPQRKFSL